MPPTTATEGFWGRPTSTIDWCEKNYEINFYVAEWWNTISNLFIILPPLWGIYEVFNQGFEKRFIFCNFLVLSSACSLHLLPLMLQTEFSYFSPSWYVIATLSLPITAVVGVGSWMFHMTLLYEMQLFDELPMVYGSLSLLYCLLEVPKPSNKIYFSNIPLFICLSSFGVIFTLLYLLWPQPWFQHISYGVIILWSYWLEIKIVRQKKCKVCKRIFLLSLSLFLFAFFLWNIDKTFCSDLEIVRGNALYGVGPLTQLHAWWHALAGYSSYLIIFFCIHSWYDYHKQEDEKRILALTHFGLSLRWS